MIIKRREETFFHQKLYSIASFRMKKRDAILFKMKYLKIETQIEKSLTLFSRKISDFYVTTKSFKIQ